MIITKENIKKAAEVMLAYAQGKDIQRQDSNGKWIDCPVPMFDWASYNYRIKPQLIDTQPNQWISVDDDLPCYNSNNIHFGFTNNVLAIDDNKNTFIAYMKKYKDKKWIWDSSDNPNLSHHITHWMPMPNIWISIDENLPKQDEEVIVLCDDSNIAPNYKISFGHIVDKTIYQDYNGWNIPNVVYWFPMPKLSNK